MWCRPTHQELGHSLALDVTTSISVQLSLEFASDSYSVDEAVAAIHRIHLQLEAVELYRLKLKWWMGCVLTHTSRPEGRRTDIVQEVADRLLSEYGIRAGKSLLYQCMKLFQALSGDYDRYLAWIDAKQEAVNRPVYWYDVVNDLLGGPNNPAVIGREEADERDYRQAERAVEAIERIVMRAAEGNEEAAGVLEGLRQNLLGLMLIDRPSSETPRCAEYLTFVASFGCAACGRPADPHHAVGRRGTAVKPSDFGCVPLCRDHHVALHQSGTASFERFYRIDMQEIALNLLHRYITGRWLTMTLQVHSTGL